MSENGQNLPELPTGWVWANAEECTTRITDGEHITPKRSETGVLLLSARNVQNGFLSFHKVDYVPTEVYESLTKRLKINPGDVLMSCSGTVGRSCVAPSNLEFALVRSVAVLKPLFGMGKFLSYSIRSPQLQRQINEKKSQTAQANIFQGKIKQLLFAVPPLEEQHRIVNKIEELFTQLDAGVDLLKKLKLKLKRYRQAVLKAAVEGKLTQDWRAAHQDELEPASVLLDRILKERREKWEADQLAKMEAKGKIPKDDKWKLKYKEPPAPDTEDLPELPTGWNYTFIESLLSFERTGMKTGPFGSLLKKHEHMSEGIPVLGIENIAEMKFIAGSKIHISKEKATQLSEYSAYSGDILISRSGTVGEVCVVPKGLGETRISTNLMRLSLAANGMLPLFFCFLFNGSPIVLNQVSELCKGSTRIFLNQGILKSIFFLVPPIKEQYQIIENVEYYLSLVEQINRLIENNLKRAEKLRQSILKEAFEGKLVPQDPNDEPASLLLERIREEKAQQEAKNKKRKTTTKKKKSRKTTKTKQLESIDASNEEQAL